MAHCLRAWRVPCGGGAPSIHRRRWSLSTIGTNCKLLWLDLIGAIPLALAMVQEAATSTQQAPHPLTARAAWTCCGLAAVGPLHAAGSLQAPLLIDLAMVRSSIAQLKAQGE